ncbi:MAG: Ig-like domain-containing protein, partial [Spirochaetota bacterium]
MKKIRTALFLIMLAAPAFLTGIGCSKGSDDVDTTPPEIVSIYPADDADEVAVSVNISLTFDKEVTGVSTNSITLEKVGSFGTVNANVVYDSDSRQATLDPVNSLEADSIYVITVTDSIKSRSGVAFEAMSSVFKTGVVADTTRPSVSLSIVNDEPGVEIEEYSILKGKYIGDFSVTASFSEQVKASTVTDSTFFLTNTENGERVSLVAVSTNQHSDNTYCTKAYLAVTDDPSTMVKFILSEWTQYQITLSDGIVDMSGNTLTGLVSSFQTEDETKPSIVNVTPADGASDVASNGQISVEFSERLKSSTINGTYSTFTLTKKPLGGTDDEQILVPAIYYDSSKTAVITPPELLVADGAEYTINVTEGVTDRSGNTLSNAGTWTFTAGSS